MFHPLARFTSAHPWLICTAWVVFGGLLNLLAPNWDNRATDDDIRFLPERTASRRGYQLLEQAFPQDVFASRLVFAVERQEQPLTDADFALVGQLVADLDQLRREQPELKIGKIVSCRDAIIGGRLTSADRRCTLIQVPLGNPYLALQTRDAVDQTHAKLKERMSKAGPDAPALYATGSAGIGRDLTHAAGESLEATTLATILLVVVVLLLVYRAPLLALIPLATIAVSVWVSLNLLALATLIPGVHLVNISKVFAIVILYGAGTDYCLFLISRYREELEKGQRVRPAAATSTSAVGSALAASAGTVMIGLGLMGLAEFAKVRYAGPAIALSLGVALLAALTLTPALLCLAGKTAFWPRPAPNRRSLGLLLRPSKSIDNDEPPGLPRRDKPAGSLNSAELFGRPESQPTLWDWVSRKVAAYPIAVWSAAVLVLFPLACLGFQVTPNYRPTGELSRDTDSLRGLAAIQRHFTAGETGPVTVLLTSPASWDSPEGRERIHFLSQTFRGLEGVAEVRSLTQPLGTPLPNFGKNKGGLFGQLDQALKSAHDYYVAQIPDGRAAKHVTRLDLVLQNDPFDAPSLATLRLVQTWLRTELKRTGFFGSGLESECYGVTVCAADLAEVTESDRVRVNVLILAGIFLILLVLVRRPWFALYLLVTVLFSYYATLGATALAGILWTGHPLMQVDWRVPFFLFTILVAVGEDYNILLVTRAMQESVKHGLHEGMRRALAKTGGAITSCGLIMAGTFATLMIAELGTLKQIGFALAFGVLLDTFVVRPFLVPSLALLIWREKKAKSAPAAHWRRAA